ncbi:hypothetical protein COCSUDRAFT_52973 [Coccomyxa subellipsoidea C-169]|uniref:Uncharacterized protein n=1 Tax=Coccomyxa subellipsoidea (strain C-169) TaxID=574566 RepID=I0Z1F5_COCSC|nr:hypothetical protein COCSUDRAFT_52973 [Coccomyxa subellipsoidea C-169]EIE24474.1 hypothetical protein COCSUDRAFT_52973 [Coccomyxa subellipsoidea C-169]|eukprot:XP_005649018.1 hypothetical protein COCSUDRAFT_52973 [Coccomyxa subellipsoidea C-169]
MASQKCMMCMAVLVMACFISTTTAQMPAVDPNFKMPKNIKSYSEYLKYVGMAQGILPIEPLAEEAFAPGPSQGVEAPSGAPAAEAQPDFMANRVANPNPTIEDFVQAYQPVAKALDYAFETRITKDNAQKVQWNLAIAAAPLQMLINDANQAQIKNFQKVTSEVVSGQNPLTGTAATTPTTEAQPATASDGTTVTSTAATAATTGADATATPATAAADPLGWLRMPSFLGKK